MGPYPYPGAVQSTLWWSPGLLMFYKCLPFWEITMFLFIATIFFRGGKGLGKQNNKSSFLVHYYGELVSENWDFYFIANFKFNFMKLSEEQCNMKYPVTWTEFRATLPFSRNWERGQILLDFFPFHVNAVFPSALKPGMSWVLSKYKSHPPPPPSYGLSPW